MAYDVMKVANRLLQRAQDDVDNGGELLTNLKLQKLLYYEQGFHLAYFGTPLFDEDIEAWLYGPVVPCVYNHFKKCGSDNIKPETSDWIEMTEEEEEVFEAVFTIYSKYSAIGLMQKTHKESPWINAGKPQPGNIITKEALKKYFETQLE